MEECILKRSSFTRAAQILSALVLTAGGTQSALAGPNNAPHLVPIPLQICEGTTLTFTAHATDPDSPPQILMYSLVGAPSGASIDPLTGVFSWSPAPAQNRLEYFFQVRVTDNGVPALSDTVTVQAWVAQSPASGGDLRYSCKINWRDASDHSKGYVCLCNGPSSGCMGTANGCSDAGSTCVDH